MSGGNSWREPAPITGVLRKGVACSHTSTLPGGPKNVFIGILPPLKALFKF